MYIIRFMVMLFESIARITCPALILAANRKDKVMGRIIELITSTIAKNGDKIIGEASGKWLAWTLFIAKIIPVISIVNHIGNPIAIVNLKWEVMVVRTGTAPVIFKISNE